MQREDITSISLDSETKEKIDNYCSMLKISRSSAVKMILNKYFMNEDEVGVSLNDGTKVNRVLFRKKC